MKLVLEETFTFRDFAQAEDIARSFRAQLSRRCVVRRTSDRRAGLHFVRVYRKVLK